MEGDEVLAGAGGGAGSEGELRGLVGGGVVVVVEGGEEVVEEVSVGGEGLRGGDGGWVDPRRIGGWRRRKGGGWAVGSGGGGVGVKMVNFFRERVG